MASQGDPGIQSLEYLSPQNTELVNLFDTGTRDPEKNTDINV